MDHLTALLPTWASTVLTTTTTTTSCLVFTTGSVIVLVTLIGTKNLPLAYAFRLLPSLYRLLKPRYSSSASPSTSKTASPQSPAISGSSNSTTFSAHPSLFTHHVTSTRCFLPEIDINVHKSNSTFFTDADISRAVLLTSLLGNGLANLPSSPSNKGGKPGMFLLASVSAKFLRPIAPLEPYEVSSRILSWEEGPTGRALYTVTYFLRCGMAKKLAGEGGRELEVEGGPAALIADDKLKRGVFAVLVSRYVFKRGRESLSPEMVLMASGLLSTNLEKAGSGKGEEWMDGEKVQRAVGNGLEYVKGCMV